MGVVCQSMLKNKSGRYLNPHFPSVRMAMLFYEFLGRYNEWKLAKLQEMIGLLVVLFLGLGILLFPWFLPKHGMTLSIAVAVLFYFAARYYLKVNERVSHIYVNLHILHHHLLGKLEVGFCDHREPCQCAGNFQSYVWKHYHLTLDKNFLI